MKPLQEVVLKGINWFGFEVDGGVHGLWAGPSKLMRDFQTVAHRMRVLGINAIRLPFSFKQFAGNPGRSFAYDCDWLDEESIIYTWTTKPGRVWLGLSRD